MSTIIDHHKTEAANLALEMYDLEQSREQIKARMRELSVIIKTAEHYEAEKAQRTDAPPMPEGAAEQ